MGNMNIKYKAAHSLCIEPCPVHHVHSSALHRFIHDQGPDMSIAV